MQIRKLRLKRLISNYFKEIHKIYVSGGFREESFYPCFKRLVEECSRLILTKKVRKGIRCVIMWYMFMVYLGGVYENDH